MSDGNEELFRQHHASFEKLTYFLLASAGTSMGFGITLKDALSFTWPDVLLILSITLWGFSFGFGIRTTIQRRQIIYANHIMLKTIASDPMNSDMIRHAASEFSFEPLQKKINRNSALQLYLLFLGAISILFWRIAAAYPEFMPYPFG